ncbi:SEC7 domain protein [Pyrenophora tritici-repentis]|uniref:SEC7 domain protein n=1 Tax=Pyrenophora tritici-repentis TaxID=45151 RepID=A0A2W1HA20_9PLEO|nr:SEC7 domain protein [Pyrenophora tritici-repentis]KAI1512489.1 Sec7 domain containing protein [Pyrenophora tritici-repentis]KAI1665313.1 Sec7 domain containing protein [Pyrenophora tritici-repentis]KAI1677881.1 Sec7 domain containing protein [Pyrenophora tritici-repentis]PZD45989.1 SEC7 domain protein [Pyrenophora tritici-repentis]
MANYAYDHGRPSTPTGSQRTCRQNASMRALNTAQPRHETFFDDATPVDHSAEKPLYNSLRDSHDLTFAEHGNVRDSVVDNMLLSLDQFSTGNLFGGGSSSSQYAGGYAEDDFFLRDSSYRPPGPRHRGHTYTSSRSSDYDLGSYEPSRYTAQHSRARRSNSSNNIGTPVARKSSTRDIYSSRQVNSPYGLQQLGHLRGGPNKGSKGSSTSSMDFGPSAGLSNQRMGFGKRSASFDHSNASDRGRISPLKVESVLDRGRMAYQHSYTDEYDAAPEPTIPAGPRKLQEPPLSPLALPPQPSYVSSQAARPGRRGSVRSNTSYRTLRKNKSQPGPNMRAQAQEFVNASTLRELPPVPLWHDPSAPSPGVAARSPLFPSQSPAAASKPGFFRRVFGGGSSKAQPQLSTVSAVSHATTTTQRDPSPASVRQQPADVNSIYSMARPRTTPSNNGHIATQLKSIPKAPPTASSVQMDTSLSQLPALGKKPSSFFRRRKKSMTESVKPPLMPVDVTQPQKPILPAQPSPGVSSLRQVMNPYLNDAGRAGERTHEGQDEQSGDDAVNGERPLGFSPGYKPHKDATVRTVRPNSRGDDLTPPTSQGDQLRASQWSNNTGSPKLKLKLKHGRQTIPQPQEDSFLADSSSCNEDYSGRATPTGDQSGVDHVRRPSTGPAASSLKQIGGRSSRKPSVDHKTDLLASHEKVTSRGALVSQSASEGDEGWLITASSEKVHFSNSKSPAAKRVWLDTTLPDSLGDTTDNLKLPLEGAHSSQQSLDQTSPQSTQDKSPISPDDVFHSASSLPIVQVESRESTEMPSATQDRSTHTEPTDAERERAFQIYSGDDSSSLKAQAAAMLGDVTLSSTRTRKAFMDLFDWTGFNILAAMRDLCGKIILKAETQQVDRILMSLSERWCECNANHGFKAVDVVHTICYSILLLNTDLHLADIESRMTRSQFVRNTLPTVTRVCQDAVKAAADETLRPHSTQLRRPSLPWNDKSEPNSPGADTTAFPADAPEEPMEARKSRSRLSIRPPVRSGSEGLLNFDSAASEPNTLVNTPYNGPMRGWEFQIETVLKEFYDSIRKQRLPLHGSSEVTVHHQPSSNNLSVGGMLRRTPSVLSKAPSDNASYRGRSQNDFRSMSNRWASKNRSKQKLYPSSTVASSRTSLDDQSVWSPAGSSTWSRYSYGKTGTSLSVDSLGSHFANGDYQQAIGFANALSQAIIREEGMTIASDEEFSRVAPLLEDETLELVGAPWAKEGILKHKRHLEGVDRKAKDRAWNECFAVVEKGCMRLFSFSMNSKSVRQKSKLRPSAGGVVGGGNWMDNAEALDSFQLRQTIASALPPPGYSKTRPHVFALSLPNGAVHLFQVGTPDICREFVTTVNYWSARLSKEPLMGGVSSMEYGWGENVINPALIRQDSAPSVQGHMPRPSVASSIRSSMDHGTNTPKPRLPGDKVVLSDWSPPASSMMASTLMEVDQLRALTDYVKNIENELSHHNELRAPLLIAFSPRHPNAAKAMANWERKSQYLLREIVKFRTYIDTLSTAQAAKQKIYAEREAREKEMEDSDRGAETDTSAKFTEDDGAQEASEPPASQPMPNPALPAAFPLHP